MTGSLEQGVNTLYTELYAGLADPKRIMILYQLAEGPKTVTERCHALSMPQSAVSRHLMVMRDRGMATAASQGAAVEYRPGDPRLLDALDLMRAVLRDTLARGEESVEQLG